MEVRLVLLVLFPVLLAGCIHKRHQQDSDARLPIWQPAHSYAIQQVIEGKTKEKHFQLQSLIELTPNLLKLIFLTEHGQRVATVTEQNAVMTSEISTFIPEEFDPKIVVNAFKMAYWPIKYWKKNTIFEVEYDPTHNERYFYEQGALKTTVRFEDDCPLSGKLEFIDHQYHYTLKIQSLLINHDQSSQPCTIQ